MGFAAKWAAVIGEPQPPTPKDQLDRMDTIRGGQPEDGSSVHIVHTVHKGARPADSEAKGNSVHCVHIVHKDSTKDALSTGASAPASGTGLDWLPGPPDDADPSFKGWWAAFDLADVCRLYDVRIVHAGKRVIAIYPQALEAKLAAYAGSLLVEAQPYLAAHLDKLPILTPAQAVEIILGIMRRHPGLRFCRGEGGSMWPLYPRHWSAGQRVTLQALWYVAGENLDADSFIGIGAG